MLTNLIYIVTVTIVVLYVLYVCRKFANFNKLYKIDIRLRISYRMIIWDEQYLANDLCCISEQVWCKTVSFPMLLLQNTDSIAVVQCCTTCGPWATCGSRAHSKWPAVSSQTFKIILLFKILASEMCSLFAKCSKMCCGLSITPSSVGTL